MSVFKLRSLFLIVVLSVVSACGGGGGSSYSGSNDAPTEEEDTPAPQKFSTRLNSRLLIAGERCQGNEEVVFGEETFTCEQGQYLVIIDNANVCDEDSGCTEIGVEPVIGILKKANVTSPPELTFYDIIPQSPVGPDQRRDVDRVRVRTDMNGPTKVVFK